MPKKKMKTKSILKSGRIKFTGTGKIMVTRSNKSHFKTTKSKRANRAGRRMHELKPCFAKMIRRLMPYSYKKKV